MIGDQTPVSMLSTLCSIKRKETWLNISEPQGIVLYIHILYICDYEWVISHTLKHIFLICNTEIPPIITGHFSGFVTITVNSNVQIMWLFKYTVVMATTFCLYEYEEEKEFQQYYSWVIFLAPSLYSSFPLQVLPQFFLSDCITHTPYLHTLFLPRNKTAAAPIDRDPYLILSGQSHLPHPWVQLSSPALTNSEPLHWNSCPLWEFHTQ